MIDDGGPAFPQTRESWVLGGTGTVPEGMSVRDIFAKDALPVAWHILHDRIAGLVEPPLWAMLAGTAYGIADAMLAERRKNDTP
jgi:hypothetical protein